MTSPSSTVEPNTSEWFVSKRSSLLSLASEELKPRVAKPDLKVDLPHGWYKDALFAFDSLIWGRWAYNVSALITGRMPDEPLPKIEWTEDIRIRKMLERSLDTIPGRGSGSWMSWSSSDYFNFFLDFLLYAFGDQTVTELKEPHGCEGAISRLYQLVNIAALQLFPWDFFADLLADTNHGKHNGFFPTPMHICSMITQMTMGDGTDHRHKEVLDPCVGTGRFLLTASNYSMALSCQDIDVMMIKATRVNGWLYAPWLVCRPRLAIKRAIEMNGPAAAITAPVFNARGQGLLFGEQESTVAA